MHRGLMGWALVPVLLCLLPRALAAAEIDIAALALEDCPDEPGCPALILRDEMSVNNQSGRARMSFRRAIKVFTAEGVDRWANVKVTAVAGAFNIRNLEGHTVLPDGRRIALDQDNIQVKTVLRMGRTRVLMKSAMFPGVVPGAVIDYRYDLFSEKPADFIGFQWDIQAEVPALRSDLVLRHGGVKFTWLNLGHEKLHISEDHPFPNVHKFSTVNVPSIPREPFGLSPEVWRARMHFHDPEAGPLWLTYYGSSLGLSLNGFMRKNKLLAERIGSLRRPGDSTAQTIGAIYRFVQESIGPASEAEDEKPEREASEEPGADDVLEQGGGTDLQRTMLFVALLREAGLQSALVAVAGRDHATLDPALPDDSQFNAHVAAVLDGARWTYYDPATRHCPFGMVAPSYENVLPNAIIVMPDRGVAKGVVVIPVSPASRNLLTRDVSVSLQPDGSAVVEARDEGEGLVDLDHRQRYGALPEHERAPALESWLHSGVPLARVESASFENLGSFTGKARIRYRFVLPGLAVATGDTLVISPSVLHGMQAAPFTADARRTPVDFGHTQKTVERIAFAIPAGYVARSTPEPVVLREGPLSLITSCTVQPDEIVFTRRLEIDAATWAAEDYPRLKAFFDKVREADQQALILSREGVK